MSPYYRLCESALKQLTIIAKALVRIADCLENNTQKKESEK